MPPPMTDPRGKNGTEPVGRALNSAAKSIARAFSDELAAAGGSMPVWLVLVALKQGHFRTQQEIATAAGIEGPTLTHHLDALERGGFIVRTRGTADRRLVRVELTPQGEALFEQLREAAERFDRGLRAGISAEELQSFRDVLGRLRANAEALRQR
jgi:MarR family transcriptional regulator, transcriptional regulator for hemolysin